MSVLVPVANWGRLHYLAYLSTSLPCTPLSNLPQAFCSLSGDYWLWMRPWRDALFPVHGIYQTFICTNPILSMVPPTPLFLPLTHTPVVLYIRLADDPHILCTFGMWERPGAPVGNTCGHRRNVRTPHSTGGQDWAGVFKVLLSLQSWHPDNAPMFSFCLS